MRTIKSMAFFLVVLSVLFVVEGTASGQCAMCRTALQNSPEGQQMAQGFRYGILFLLAAPYAIIGSIAVGVIRHFRNR